MKAVPSGWLPLVHLRGYVQLPTVLKSPAADHGCIGRPRIARVAMLTQGLRRVDVAPRHRQSRADTGICNQVPGMRPRGPSAGRAEVP